MWGRALNLAHTSIASSSLRRLLSGSSISATVDSLYDLFRIMFSVISVSPDTVLIIYTCAYLLFGSFDTIAMADNEKDTIAGLRDKLSTTQQLVQSSIACAMVEKECELMEARGFSPRQQLGNHVVSFAPCDVHDGNICDAMTFVPYAVAVALLINGGVQNDLCGPEMDAPGGRPASLEAIAFYRSVMQTLTKANQTDADLIRAWRAIRWPED